MNEMLCAHCGVEFDCDGEGMYMAHRCCACRDGRRIRYALKKGHTNFGRAFPCPECAGYTLAQLEQSRRELAARR